MNESRRYYIRRTIIAGVSVFIISLLAGIAFRGWHEYHTPMLQPFTVSERLFVSTVGPLAGAFLLLGPFTRANHFWNHGFLRLAVEANMVIALCIRVNGFVLAFNG